MAKEKLAEVSRDMSGEFADWVAERTMEPSNGKTMRLGICIALYTVLALIWAPGISFGDRVFDAPSKEKKAKTRHTLKQPPEQPLETVQVRKPKTKKTPMPDRTPNQPEPMIEKNLAVPPDLLQTDDWEIGIPDVPAFSGEDILEMNDIGVEGPIFTKKVLPNYPTQAVRIRLEGYVMLQAVLRQDGTIDQIKILRQIGKGKFGFEEKAIEALKSWEFLPGKVNGKPADIRMNLKIEFILNQ